MDERKFEPVDFGPVDFKAEGKMPFDPWSRESISYDDTGDEGHKWIWCLVGNIAEDSEDENFKPGVKVCIAPTTNPEKAVVIGLPRFSRSYFEAEVEGKIINNCRMEKLYNPFILRMIEASENKWWDNSEESKVTIQNLLGIAPAQRMTRGVAKNKVKNNVLWDVCRKLKNFKWVSLSHMLDNDSPYWSGIPEGSVSLGDVLWDWGKPELECMIQSFKFPGQFGTHIDFPAHFIRTGEFAESFTEKDAVLPLCVIDISGKVAEDPHYCVSVEDIKEYEAQYGEIPEGAFVALRTDWYKNWPDADKMSGIAEDGSENFPAWSLEAIKYIYEVRNAAANGHETLDTDGSEECKKYGDLVCERYVLGSGRFQVEAMCNLDQVPPSGAILFLAWPNFKGANGLPCRAWAICEK